MHHPKISSSAVSTAQLKEVVAMYVQYPESLPPVIGEAVRSEPYQNAVHWPLHLGIALGAHMAVVATRMPMGTRDGSILSSGDWCLSVVDVACARRSRRRVIDCIA